MLSHIGSPTLVLGLEANDGISGDEIRSKLFGGTITCLERENLNEGMWVEPSFASLFSTISLVVKAASYFSSMHALSASCVYG